MPKAPQEPVLITPKNAHTEATPEAQADSAEPKDVLPPEAIVEGVEPLKDDPKATPEGPPPPKQPEDDGSAGAGVQEHPSDDDEPRAIAGLDADTAAISPFGHPATVGAHQDSVTDPDNPVSHVIDGGGHLRQDNVSDPDNPATHYPV
jgi:hypothetical protein